MFYSRHEEDQHWLQLPARLSDLSDLSDSSDLSDLSDLSDTSRLSVKKVCIRHLQSSKSYAILVIKSFNNTI